ncbi:D-glucuronate isomerase [Anseongella ginsenosidimutans]|uniref:Uronate isomerase n=1 Tax=Anseongella ginsenosidimutans TaxID=496056 RepID=A0A4R3KSU0_9SPHI|nr:glucuronate isomerase [Anseongella ginsenosidimutans]QEC52249.1 glucuronate isomerase [Anseongella ginsenosidimutans]TCS86801.1 D-glucuronate isomerase [Anseongella ginsenosidimutans]
MESFLSEHFLLQTESARLLYHDYAAGMPVIDYHNHLPPAEIAADRRYENMTQLWLHGDHYKWRAMRANGVEERYITGDADDETKFIKWAETVPYTMRNPLYHWTHMELRNPFGITDILNSQSAGAIYRECNRQLQETFSARSLLRHYRVEALCTTDDPCDSLEHHLAIARDPFGVRVLPAFRADKALAIENPEAFNQYMDRLSEAADIDISNYSSLLEALKARHDFFHQAGCRVSDHGLDTFYSEEYTDEEVLLIFLKVREGTVPSPAETAKFKSALLYFLAVMDYEKGWVQQFHVGALRNANSRLLSKLGADAGVDSIDDLVHARRMMRFFDRLDREEKLARTIVYNLNPADNEIFATMMGNYQDSSIPGKMQFGSGWWYLDQKDGMEKQLNTLSNIGLLSRFIGMLTDSRSFVSFPRHEYFRRILCNLIGRDVENGELPNDTKWLGQMIQNICYYNAKTYFSFLP